MSIIIPKVATTLLTTSLQSSRFSTDDLSMLMDPRKSYLLPLAMIAFVDLNAFFAQCEQNRLGRSITDPVVCAQWNALIAVSYAARKFGINRMDSVHSARQKCPDLVVGHAAVFKKGETHWQYLDGPPDQALHKVSLDPYRRELRKIIKILMRECDLVEKASVDECYMDLGRLVHLRLMDLFPQLREPGSMLPPVPEELPFALQWEGEVVASKEEEDSQGVTDINENNEEKKDDGEGEEKEMKPLTQSQLAKPTICDWDDVCFLIGSQILYKIRRDIYEELNYTTSGGLATTRTVAKLAGGYVKPDYQTIIRPRLIIRFLDHFDFTDFTLMGAKMGEMILQKLEVPSETNSIHFIRENYSLPKMKETLPADYPADKVYELVRGNHRQELKLRTAVKSMMSRKNFLNKHPVDTMADAYDWVKVFIGDLYGRLIELDDENMNLSMLQQEHGEKGFIYRPRTINVQFTTVSYSRYSKQTKFPVLKDLDKLRHALEVAGFKLLGELLEGTKAVELNPGVKFRELKMLLQEELFKIKIPNLANMSFILSNFVKTNDANLIDSYGMDGKGSTQETIKRQFEEALIYNKPKEVEVKPKAKPKTVDNSYVQKIFEDYHSENSKNMATAEIPKKAKRDFKEDKEYVQKLFTEYETSAMVTKAATRGDPRKTSPVSKDSSPIPDDPLLRELIKNRHCSQCNVAVEDVFEHKDYHVALDLSLRLNGKSVSPSRSAQNSPKRKKSDTHKPKPQKKSKLAKGQTQLPF